MRHQLRSDRHNAIREAIMATNDRGVGIYIDILVVTGSNEENFAPYQIKHGNYFPTVTDIIDGKEEVLKATWDQFYIDGKDDGFPKGFQSYEDVELFIGQEIARIEDQKTQALLSNTWQHEGVEYERWKLVLEAWKAFQEKFLTAKKNGRLITQKAAKDMENSMNN